MSLFIRAVILVGICYFIPAFPAHATSPQDLQWAQVWRTGDYQLEEGQGNYITVVKDKEMYVIFEKEGEAVRIRRVINIVRYLEVNVPELENLELVWYWLYDI